MRRLYARVLLRCLLFFAKRLFPAVAVSSSDDTVDAIILARNYKVLDVYTLRASHQEPGRTVKAREHYAEVIREAIARRKARPAEAYRREVRGDADR